MDVPESSPPATRRRGKQLEDAILDAAWQQLVDGGYGLFTVEAVAERAATSRHVIYRRWSTREKLVLAAVEHSRDDIRVPDTGSLRGDVIAFLGLLNETRMSMAAVLSALLGAYYQETGISPAELREELRGDRPLTMKTLVGRAVDRGEVDPAHLTPHLVDLPMDLFRQEILMTFTAVPERRILEIVDEVFLPLVQRRFPQG